MPIIESFASAFSLASAFSGGRDVKKNVDLLEFLSWLVEQGDLIAFRVRSWPKASLAGSF